MDVITKENAEGLYSQAIQKWGLEFQIVMVFEEMAELQKELCKFIRGGVKIEDLTEEIADVEIMLEQMKFAFQVGTEVEKQKKYKLNRLWGRLNGKA